MLLRLQPADRRLLTVVGTVVYALFLVTAQFEHHDFICHLKNPQHCSSCTSSQLGSDPQPALSLGSRHLDDAGRAFTVAAEADDTLLAVRSTGRSPPFLA
jgi:hypothetical protein